MKDIKVLASSLQWVFGDACAQANTDHVVIQRRRKFSASTLAQTLVFGFWRHPDATLTQLAQTAAELGCPVSPQAIKQRCNKSAGLFLEHLLGICLQKRIQTKAGNLGWLNQFHSVELLDSTTLTLPAELRSVWPGCSSTKGQTAALKVQTRFDFLQGQLRLELRPGKENDQQTSLKTEDLQPGSLHVRDLGYFELETLQTIDAKGAYFVSRLQDSTVLYDTKGQRLDLLKQVRRYRGGVLEIAVLVGKTQRLPMRLLALRVPAAVAKARRRKLRLKGRKKGYEPQARTLALRGWSIYVTNASATLLSAAQVQALMRLRWQIELLFKLWKSQSGLDRSRSKDPDHILCETYAKLLAVLLQHWLMVLAQWQKLNRSWFKAAQTIRDWVTVLLQALPSLPRLVEQLYQLCKVVNHTSRTDKRRKKPAAFQVMDDPEGNGYQTLGP